MEQGLLFQNAKIKSRESTLFGKDRMQRLSDAANLDEAMKLLLEGGYPAGKDHLEMLAAAEKEAEEFFRASAVQGYGLECFSVLSDYHNAKVAAKILFFGGAADCYKADGTFPPEELAEKIKKEEYGALPYEMGTVFTSLKKQSVTDGFTPSAIDRSLDRAAFLDIKNRLKKAHPVIRDYFVTYADLTNLETAYRAKNALLSAEETRAAFLPLGEISEIDLLKIFSLGLEEGAEKILLKPAYRKAVSALKQGIAAYEAFTENALLAPLKKARFDMFSPAAIIGFYLGKKREIKNVRLILAGIKNGVDKEIITSRLRELYV